MENRLRRGDAVQLWVLRNFPLCSRSLLFLAALHCCCIHPLIALIPCNGELLFCDQVKKINMIYKNRLILGMFQVFMVYNLFFEFLGDGGAKTTATLIKNR